MAFGFLKKALGFAGKVAGLAGKVSSFIPGVGGVAGKALQIVGKGAQAVAGGTKTVNTILQARNGVPPVLQAVSLGRQLISSAVASKQSAVMPGGVIAGTQTSAQTKGTSAYRQSKAKAKKGRKTAKRLKGYAYGKARRYRRQRGRRNRGLTPAQLRAGFGGRRRMGGR